MASVRRQCTALVLILLAAGLLTLPTESHGVSFTVNGTANIFGAGHATPPAPEGGGAGTLPPGFSFTAGPGQVVTFSSVTGIVNCCSGGQNQNGPDGGAFDNTDINSVGGISGIVHTNRVMFLVGVFLDATEPGDPAPARLNFTDPENFATLSPLIEQTFFIGDGLTDTGGLTQQFIVPLTATRLFLGFADAFGFDGPVSAYGDNSGSLTGTFTIAQVSQPIPEPATWLLLGTALTSLTGYALWRRQRG